MTSRAAAQPGPAQTPGQYNLLQQWEQWERKNTPPVVLCCMPGLIDQPEQDIDAQDLGPPLQIGCSEWFPTFIPLGRPRLRSGPYEERARKADKNQSGPARWQAAPSPKNRIDSDTRRAQAEPTGPGRGSTERHSQHHTHPQK